MVAMELSPAISMMVLLALAFFVIVTAVRSMVRVATRVLVVGLIVAVLVGSGIVQVPGDIDAQLPEFNVEDTVGVIGNTITGFIVEADLQDMEEVPELVGNMTDSNENQP